MSRREVISGAPLRYVGVFQNADIADVCQKAAICRFLPYSLHGSEDPGVCQRAARGVAAQCAEIWKALSVSNAASRTRLSPCR
ncbi:hypothetical protein KCP70_25335 [Salmonella enterica subsp. enterica]|nr:hypothetical protein KCP70_25335 [Salmonella enterica subsp. enterica]